MGDLLLAGVRRAGRPRCDRGRATGRPWPAGHDVRAPRPGRRPVAGPCRPVRAAGRRTVGAAGGANVRRAADGRASLRQRVPRTRCAPHRRGRPPRPNCDELVTATLAAELAGIAAPINSGLSGEHIAELLRRSGARVLVAAGPDLAPKVWESARARRRGRDGSASSPEPDRRGPGGGGAGPIDGVRVGHLSALAAEQPHDAFVGEAPSATDLAALFHTGGTTGTPKLAAHTHANEVSDAWMIAVNGLLHDDAVVFAALPLFHVNASSSPFWRHCSGASRSSGPAPRATATRRSTRTSGRSSSATGSPR